MEKTKEVKKESEKDDKSPTEERLNPLAAIDEKQELDAEKKEETPETSGPTLKKGNLICFVLVIIVDPGLAWICIFWVNLEMPLKKQRKVFKDLLLHNAF